MLPFRLVQTPDDPQALEATAANADRNRIAERVFCAAPAGCAESGADIVLANILAGPLVDLATSLVGSAADGGQIVLSGLLEEQVEMVLEAYRPACQLTGIEIRDGWARVELLNS